ncbi:hypothetical protein GCM10025859_52000 [Alicyclobacillus fastidiosus]|nr:hypothetical protein GCM10025859_52000 [Alicyclobacillus fastidiosus]
MLAGGYGYERGRFRRPKRVNEGSSDDRRDPSDVLKDMYLNLIERGWTLSQIDEMDVHFYFELCAHSKKKVSVPFASEPVAYIDQLF